jgi:hypothetical protein
MRLAWALGRLLVQPAAQADDADEATIELAWRAIPGCPDAVVVRERWQGALAGTDARVRIAASVERTADDRWLLQLDAVGPAGRGTRELVADSCDALVEAAAVIVGMVGRGAKDEPAATTQLEPANDASDPVVAAPPVRVDSREPTPPVSSPPGRFVPGWGVRVGGDFDVGILPSFGATIRGDVAAQWRRARLFVGGLHGVARRREGDDVAGSFSISAATIGAGPVWRRDALVLGGHVGVELGLVRAEGERVRTTYVKRYAWAAIDAGIELGWRFARDWILGISAAAVVPLRRWRFAIGDDPLGAIGSAGGRFGLWLGYERLPAVRNPDAGGQR